MADLPIIDIKCQSKWYWYETDKGERVKIPAGFDILFIREGSDTWEAAPYEEVEVPAPVTEIEE